MSKRALLYGVSKGRLIKSRPDQFVSSEAVPVRVTQFNIEHRYSCFVFGRSRVHIDLQTSYHHCNFDAFARTNVSTAVTVTFRTFHITICPLVTAFVSIAQINTTENIFRFQVKRILHNSRRTATRIFVLESDTVLIPALPPSVTFTILRPRRHVY